MTLSRKATRIELLSFSTPPMRAFHMTWMAFFLCFFGWFGVAPLMPVIRLELALTQSQIGNLIIASVAITVLARLAVGWLCDQFGPRRTYTWLLILGSLPVMGIGLAWNYASFLIFRLLIGVIGASFVITQTHTSLMFAPNRVGTANATTAGWGNLGGGVTQMVMPLIFAAFVALGATEAIGWRLAMVVPGMAMLVMGLLYWKLTSDTPEGDLADLRGEGRIEEGKTQKRSETARHFVTVAKDPRVWALFVIYGACFGIELTINNIAAIYYVDRFDLSMTTAGILAGLFGLMNLFARTLGGLFGDFFGQRAGLRGRVSFLGGVLLLEGVALAVFSQMSILPLAVGSMVVFSLLVQMSEGATYSVVPFINRKCIGCVSGIVGAGGNAGAVAAGFLFKGQMPFEQALLILAAIVTCCSGLVLFVRFNEGDERAAQGELAVELAATRGEPIPVSA